MAFSKVWILIISVVLIVGGGVFVWQYFGAGQKTLENGEEKVIEERVDVSDWQTYRNETYRFELKHPESWSFQESNALSPTHPDQNRGFIQISINNGINQPEDESMSPCQPGYAALTFQIGKLRENREAFIEFKDFVNFLIENPERGGPPVPKPVLIKTMLGGHNALMIGSGVYDECESAFYYVDQNSDRFTTVSLIAEKDTDKLIIDQILSTFRFIELVDTSDWQTYRNEEYGFEVKYPVDYIVTVDSLRSSMVYMYPSKNQFGTGIGNFDPDIFISVDKEPQTLSFHGTWGKIPYSEASSAKLISSEDTTIDSILFKKDYWLLRAAGNTWFSAVSFNTSYNGQYYTIARGIEIGSDGLPEAPYSGNQVTDTILISGALDRMRNSEKAQSLDRILSTFQFIK
ncbi:MAG: hypothetical protein Q8P55_01835 [bacterium]|nr:hypothetical protein [bacterium]